ncbi:Protein TolB [bacterium HR15]|nr:Protein TolB [bacterium HR15]
MGMRLINGWIWLSLAILPVYSGAHACSPRNQNGALSKPRDQIVQDKEFEAFLKVFTNTLIWKSLAEIVKSVILIEHSYDISPTEERVAYTRGVGDCTELVVVPLSGGGARPIARFRPPRIGIPRFSPDGNQIAYLTIVDENRDESGIFLYNLKTQQQQQVYRGHATNLLFAPDGNWLIIERKDGVYLLSPRGNLLPTWAKRIASYNLSPRGELCVEVDREPYYVLASWRELTHIEGLVSALSRFSRHPLRRAVESASGRIAWSPDGKHVAYVSQPGESVSEVWVYRYETGQTDLLVRQVGGVVDLLRWSPKGDKLCFLIMNSVSGQYYEAGVWCMKIKDKDAIKL